MKLSISLSTEDIHSAIERLNEAKDNIDKGVGEVVTILANEGADVARTLYGGWNVNVIPYSEPKDKRGGIRVSGDYPLMAEFGAGDFTHPFGFERIPTVVRPGSYSELHAQQYSEYGYWYFGGRKYYGIAAHQGLFNAKQYIIANSTIVAQGAIKL